MAKFRSTTDVIPAVYKEGERCCQLLILPVPDVQMIESEELSSTDRGDGGYGSTGNSDIQSAPTGSGSHEVNPDINQTAPEGSGGAQSGPEQAE